MRYLIGFLKLDKPKSTMGMGMGRSFVAVKGLQNL
jgi:hypothetical protein